MKRRLAVAGALLLVLAGCAAPDTAPSEPPSQPPSADEPTAVDAELPEALETVLAGHELTDLSARQLVDHLDRLGGAQRPSDLMASVRAEEVILAGGGQEVAMLLPQDAFYLSFAPYVNGTHDCYFHSLTTCQGELVAQDVEVRIVTSDGEVLVDEVTTTFDNGFVGYWLPRDVQATLEVTYGALTGTQDIATGPDSPTCLTTLQLA